MNLTLNDCVGLVKRLLDKPIYSKEEVCNLLCVSAEELDATSLSERSRHGQLWHLIHFDVFHHVAWYEMTMISVCTFVELLDLWKLRFSCMKFIWCSAIVKN